MTKEECVAGEYYWLNSDGQDSLAYCYRNPDADNALGFGFNIADGGGWLPLWDIKDSTAIEPLFRKRESKIPTLRQRYKMAALTDYKEEWATSIQEAIVGRKCPGFYTDPLGFARFEAELMSKWCGIVANAMLAEDKRHEEAGK